MFGFFNDDELPPQEKHPKPYSLPSPLPQWPQGQGFARGNINLGELEVTMVKDFELVATCTLKRGGVVSFYKPVSIPEGFFSLGYYCQPSHEPQPPTGYVLVARSIQQETETVTGSGLPPLKLPVNYNLLWTDLTDIFVWQPIPPKGYRALGCSVVTADSVFNEIYVDHGEVWCVRKDLTKKCDYDFDRDIFRDFCEFVVVNPKMPGMFSKRVVVGTSLVIPYCNQRDLLHVRCLKNKNPNLEAMPNLKQVEALIHHYGPTVYFRPDEVYFHGLQQAGKKEGEFRLCLPKDNLAKHGNLENAQLNVHVKPALGGTFTDIDMWVSHPIAYLLNSNIEDSKQVAGREHFTLRVSNFDGQLWGVYFSHPDKKWIHASSLEFIEGNKPIVYTSKSRHATFPNIGRYIQGAAKLFGIGDMDMFIDGSKKYEIIAAEYLGDIVAEPEWLEYIRERGRTMLCNERSKVPRPTMRRLIDLFSEELHVKQS